MRVAFAYNFDDRNWLGGKNYFSSLFNAVREVAPTGIELVLVTGNRTVTSLPQDFPFLEVIRTPMIDWRSPASLWRELQARIAPGADPEFARLLRRHRIDVLSHSGPVAGSGIKTLGWLPDFQFAHFPEYWKARHLRATKRNHRIASRSCDALVVSSRDALADLEKFAPDCRIPCHVLHFVSGPVQVEALRDKATLGAQYRLPADYFHLPNQFWAHKNHRVVIDALALLKQGGIDVTVACTGHTADVRRPAYFDSLMTHCREAGVDANFRVLGLVPYTDMQALMAHSLAVINPSTFEGWSTTVEEAKTLGKRILLSDIAVHREQAPAHGSYFAPHDPGALATLLRETASRQPLAIDAAEVAARYARSLRAFGAGYLHILESL